MYRDVRNPLLIFFQPFTRFTLSWAWILIGFLFIVMGLASLPHLATAVERIELSLLDFRLKARAETLTPSDQIMVAVMDRQSQDEARNHPELGIYSRVLPRRDLAKIVRFLAGQGAKAIILDLSFETPQTPMDDQALAEAIGSAGNVYVATGMELPLSEYRTRQQARSFHQVRMDLALAFHNQRLMPYLQRQAQRTQWLPLGCPAAFEVSGLAGLAYFSSVLPIPDGFLRQVWKNQCGIQTPSQTQAPTPLQKNVFSPAAPSSVTSHDKPEQSGPDFLKPYYRRQCVSQMYQQVFARNPGFLKLLEQRSVTVDLPERTSPPLETYCLASNMMEPILRASRGLGITTVDYNQDSSLREVPLFYQGYLGKTFAYLGLRPVLDWLPQKPRLLPHTLDWGHRRLPLTEDGKVILNWRSPRLLAKALAEAGHYRLSSQEERAITPEEGNRVLGYGHLYRTISAIDILKASILKAPILNASMAPTQRRSGLDAQTPSLYQIYGQPQSGPLSLKNKIVIYGDAIEDIHRTPVANRIYGPEIVATAVDMFLNDHVFIQKVPAGWVWFITLGLAGGIFYGQLACARLSIGFLGGLAAMALFWLLNALAFIWTGYWFPLVLPTVGLALSLAGGLLYRYIVQDREKRQLTHVFSRYVSPQVLQEIVSNPQACLQSLAGAQKNLTVLFADLQGFTERFTTEDPQRMVAQLNEFFTAMTRIILKHQGTYDKYIGDAVMAFFGAPADFPNHAAKACAAALEMQRTLEQMNAEWRLAGIPPLQMGIGLSSGDMIVGNFGSEDLQNFTVMGNAVNLGSRLESLTRIVNVPIVISAETAKQVQQTFIIQDLGSQQIKGFREPIEAFALISEVTVSAI
jgi:class 3 adenylate cyclase/CHASE2 domain-containing sensor protein